MKDKKITIIYASADNIDDVFYYKRIIEDAELQKETIQRRRTLDEFFSYINVDSLIVYKDTKVAFGIYDKFNKEAYVFCMLQSGTIDDECKAVIMETAKQILNNSLTEAVVDYTNPSSIPVDYIYYKQTLYSIPTI